jgi:hypothetical protein
MARQRSRISDSVWTFFTETIRFVVVPIVLIDLVKTNWPQLSTAFLGDIVAYTLAFGGLIVAASTLEVMNRPGTFKRMLFGLSSLAFLCLWLFVVFGGGVASFTYFPYFVRFDMSKIVYIMLVGIALRSLLVVRTYSDNKHLIVEQKDAKAKGFFGGRKQAAAPSKPARRTVSPAFGSMSRVAYQVTGDDDIGSASQPRPPIDSSEPTGTCPVCGARVGPKDAMCGSCGAWL